MGDSTRILIQLAELQARVAVEVAELERMDTTDRASLLTYEVVVYPEADRLSRIELIRGYADKMKALLEGGE